MNKLFILGVVVTVFILFNLVTAELGTSNSNLPNLKYTPATTTTSTSVNYSAVNVNNSLYWQGHTGTDGSWLTGISTYNSSYLTSITNIFDQSLNRTDNVSFNNVNVTGNLTVTKRAYLLTGGTMSGNVTLANDGSYTNYLQIGEFANTEERVKIYNLNAKPGNTQRVGLGLYQDVRPTANTAVSNRALNGYLQTRSTTNWNYTAPQYGLLYAVLHKGGGTVSEAYGALTYSRLESNGTISDGYGLDAQVGIQGVFTGGGKISNGGAMTSLVYNYHVNSTVNGVSSILIKAPIAYGNISNYTGLKIQDQTANQNMTGENRQLYVGSGGEAYFNTNVNITGNITTNSYYGEMWNKSDTTFEVVDLVTTDVYVQVKNLTCGNINGFTCISGTGNLTTTVGGVYQVNAKVGATATAIAGKYDMKVYINDVGQNNCYDHEEPSTAPIGFVISCIIRLNVGDNLNVRFDDHADPVRDLNLLNANINLVRIGN